MKALIIISVLSIKQSIAQTQLHYSGRKQAVINAVSEANRILRDSSFYQQIRLHGQFANADSGFDGNKVADEILRFNRTIEVQNYWAPLGANARTNDVIHINTAHLGRSLASITNTLVHESVHAIDYTDDRIFNFGDNREDEDTPVSATYVIGAIAEGQVR